MDLRSKIMGRSLITDNVTVSGTVTTISGANTGAIERPIAPTLVKVTDNNAITANIAFTVSAFSSPIVTSSSRVGFVIQLSDSSSFDPLISESIVADTNQSSHNITVTIPAASLGGKTYHIRIADIGDAGSSLGYFQSAFSNVITHTNEIIINSMEVNDVFNGSTTSTFVTANFGTNGGGSTRSTSVAISGASSSIASYVHTLPASGSDSAFSTSISASDISSAGGFPITLTITDSALSDITASSSAASAVEVTLFWSGTNAASGSYTVTAANAGTATIHYIGGGGGGANALNGGTGGGGSGEIRIWEGTLNQGDVISWSAGSGAPRQTMATGGTAPSGNATTLTVAGVAQTGAAGGTGGYGTPNYGGTDQGQGGSGGANGTGFSNQSTGSGTTVATGLHAPYGSEGSGSYYNGIGGPGYKIFYGQTNGVRTSDTVGGDQGGGWSSASAVTPALGGGGDGGKGFGGGGGGGDHYSASASYMTAAGEDGAVIVYFGGYTGG
tara:strand:- start:621 stop:2120 length:1500 start_codon:yes stop_codon:yes gene_type:complete